ncbi:MAG: transposase [Planctomycetaceae bacterium]|nr:transposase [Planctomycetaceae bacterium]
MLAGTPQTARLAAVTEDGLVELEEFVKRTSERGQAPHISDLADSNLCQGQCFIPPILNSAEPDPELPDHCAEQGRLDALLGGPSFGAKTDVEQGHWLLPIEDRRNPNGQGLAGMLPGISLTDYLQLVDWSSRLIRPGKQSLSASVPDILTRLQIDADGWRATLEKLVGGAKRIGTYFGGAHRLNEVAAQRGTKFLKNIVGRESPLTAPSAS